MLTGESVASSTECRIEMNINMAHGLLGCCNNDSVRKMTRELGLVLTRGTLKECKHCAKSKAKQKNVQNEATGSKV